MATATVTVLQDGTYATPGWGAQQARMGDIITIPGRWYAAELIADGKVRMGTEDAIDVPPVPDLDTLTMDELRALLPEGTKAPRLKADLVAVVKRQFE